MILRDVAGGGTGLGEERNGAQIQVACGVGRGLADGFGDGECVFGKPALSRILGLFPGGFAATTSG
jgi:hypothetical protein